MALGELGFVRYKIPFVAHWRKEIEEVQTLALGGPRGMTEKELLGLKSSDNRVGG